MAKLTRDTLWSAIALCGVECSKSKGREVGAGGREGAKLQRHRPTAPHVVPESRPHVRNHPVALGWPLSLIITSSSITVAIFNFLGRIIVDSQIMSLRTQCCLLPIVQVPINLLDRMLSFIRFKTKRLYATENTKRRKQN